MMGGSLESLGWADLLRRLANNVASIVDREIELARREARSNVSAMARAATMLITGAIVLLLGLASFVVALIFALSRVMDDWLAALVVGVVLLIIGAILAYFGKQRLQLAPLERTRETLREDVEWVKKHQA
jgi:uncharacterized membrane protein YqjE